MMETKVLNNQATFAVRFPDGTMISESGKVRFETFKSVIKRIGMERVAAYAKISKRKRLKQPYVNKSKNEILENGVYTQELVDGYYVVNKFSALNMARFLRDMSKELNLGLTIYNPCKTPLRD